MRTEYSEERILNSAKEIIKAVKQWADATEAQLVRNEKGIEHMCSWAGFLLYSDTLSTDEYEVVVTICAMYINKYYDFITGSSGWEYVTLDTENLAAKVDHIFRSYKRRIGVAV